MRELIAKSISHIFSPIIVWPIFLILILWQQPTYLWLEVLVFEFVVPTILLVLFIKWKLISDLEITQVKERRLFFCLLLLSHIVSTLLLWNDWRLMGLMIEAVGILITFFWKISAHLAANSFVIAIILTVYGWQWWPLLLLLPLIAWSRVVRKKHTIMQTVAGGVLPFLIVIIYAYFSY